MKTRVLSLITLLTIAGCGLFNSESDLEKYNPDRFKSVPADAPFEITLNSLQADEDVLTLQLNISNKTSEKLGLLMNGAGENRLIHDFFITTRDTNLVWESYKSDTRISAQGFIIVNENETFVIEEEWELVDNNEDKIRSGDYLLFAGLTGVTQEEVFEFEDTTVVGGEILREFGNVGVGRNPITISVD